MQQIFYQASPYIVLDYPKLLEAWNTSRWQGWTRIPQPNGAVAFISDNVSNYSRVGPKSVAATTTSSTNTGLVVGIVVGAIVVIGIVILLLRRGRRAVAAS